MAQRILVVDDSPFIHELVRDILTREGYEVERAMNGHEAMRAIGEDPPDLVLLDIVMPEMSGYQVCRLIRGDARLRALPVVMMTAKDTQKDRFWGLEVGADAYITKPIEEASLLETVASLLREQRPAPTPVSPEELTSETLKVRADDILERKLLELTILNEVGKLFTYIDRPDALLSNALALVARVVDFDLGSVVVALPGSPEKMVAVSYRNCPLKVSKKSILKKAGAVLAELRGTDPAQIASLDTRLVEDSSLGPDAPRHASASEMSVVLRSARGVVGVVMLFSSRQGFFIPDDRALIEMIGSQVSILLDNVRLLQERDRQVAVLELEKRRVEAILRNMGEGVVVTDWNYRIIHANPLAHELLGTGDEPLQGQLLFDHVPRQTFEVLEQQPIGEGNPTWTVRFSSLKDGYPLVSNVAVVDEKDVQTLGLIMLLRDAAAEKELDGVKVRFLENVSVALRNPLASMRGFFDLLREESYNGSPPRQREYMDVMNREMGRLAEIVEDLLSLSRVELSTDRRRPEDLPVSEILLAAVINGQSEAQERGIAIRTQIQDGLPRVRADRESAVDAASRLIANAVKLSPDGSEITVGAGPCARSGGEGFVELFVDDRGPGIPSDRRAALFEKAQDWQLLGEAGTGGLALPICRRLVLVNGGTIGVEDAPGRGSRFFFTLPAAGTQGPAG